MIKNVLNGTFYIGSSKNIHKRWIQHLCQLRKNKHHSPRLQHSFNKYGEKYFLHGVLEHCETGKLQTREQFYLDSFFNEKCLNSFTQAYSVTGENHHMFGKNHTLEARLKIKEARARQVISHSPETRAKIGRPGRKMLPGQLEKMLKAREGKPVWNKGLNVPNKLKVILPKERVEKIISLYNSGKSIESIRLSEGLDWNKIKSTLIENNIVTRNISQQKQITDAGNRKKITA